MVPLPALPLRFPISDQEFVQQATRPGMELCHVLLGERQLWSDAGNGGHVCRRTPGVLAWYADPGLALKAFLRLSKPGHWLM
eukprot:1158303-Pelagomonas_calceolata.AAC.3